MIPRRAPLVLAASLAALLAVACSSQKTEPTRYSTTAATRGDLAVTASADGVIEPVRKVEVKSKASGEVISLFVDTGDQVTPGQVLLQLLPKDAQNSFDQVEAELGAVRARLDNARAQLARSQKLHAEGLLSESDLEADELAVANAESELVRAQKARDNAAERLSETTVRSPIAGTVIAKSIEVGQVVSSAVSQVSGGTLLLTLADLAEVQVRSLVDEVDIGRLSVGLPVEIRVEAFSDRKFTGRVVKIEPQAVVQQNVTMFPVLTRIENREGLLKPGMNAEVEVLIDSRRDVVTLANDAMKTVEEGTRIAALLGLGAGEQADGANPGRGPRAVGNAPAGNGGPNGRNGARSEANNRRMVFLSGGDGTLTPTLITVGLRNWEATEVVSGLDPGVEVALVPSFTQLQTSAEFRERMQRMRGVPGVTSTRRSGS
ncbi:MAG TPA: efflux RND transporter periplasmic adaptor subunit [Thermoanaerobaculia bacterium]|nr:efflux RND transporter periplasmic adaptor subunit [Thermoanaerobaculia bacterium]